LDLSNNAIEQLPMEMSRLSNLRVLDLSNNNLRRIPAVLMSMESVRQVHLDGNPLAAMVERPLQSISDGERIRAYLRDAAEGIREWNECKVLVLGDQVRLVWFGLATGMTERVGLAFG